jgi:thiol-disulfide isomerase/thioredoxin
MVMRALTLSLLASLTLAAAAHADAPIATTEPKPMPDLRFQDMAGNETGLDAFRGQVVVLNLWATWCVPCREEMPSLDRLQAAFIGQPVRVVAVAVDRAGPERVQAFLDEIGVSHLHVYRDPKTQAPRTLKVPGLPATFLIDREGREVGRVLGEAQWDSDAVQAVVRRLEQEGGGADPGVVCNGS